jgi:hypothetical protein
MIDNGGDKWFDEHHQHLNIDKCASVDETSMEAFSPFCLYMKGDIFQLDFSCTKPL